MSASGLLIIDANNIAAAANSTTKLHAGEMEVQAIFGFLRTLRAAQSIYGALMKPICCWDGRSWRYDIYPDYKKTRNKPVEEQTKSDRAMAEARKSLNEQRPHIRRALELLGVSQLIAMNYEADDLAGMLVRRYRPQERRMLLLSGDKDWIQLVGPFTGYLDPIRDIKITPKTLEEKTGVKDVRAFLEMKALMGDVSDNVSGVGGIGDKGAKELLNSYGSVTAFTNAWHEGTLTDVPKKFRDFAESVDKQAIFLRNLRLMDLMEPKERPEPQDLVLTKGALDVEGFAQFAREFEFNSILSDLSGWIAPFKTKES